MNSIRIAATLALTLLGPCAAGAADAPPGAMSCSGCHPAGRGVDASVPRLIGREPAAREAPSAGTETRSDALTRVFRAAEGAFAEFLSRKAAVAVLMFVVLYKLCDALAGAMTAPFVLSGLGYDKGTYAAIVKGVGLAAALIGGFAGGAVARALPLATALWLGAILQMISNLAFAWLYFQPVSTGALTAFINGVQVVTYTLSAAEQTLFKNATHQLAGPYQWLSNGLRFDDFHLDNP